MIILNSSLKVSKLLYIITWEEGMANWPPNFKFIYNDNYKNTPQANNKKK